MRICTNSPSLGIFVVVESSKTLPFTVVALAFCAPMPPIEMGSAVAIVIQTVLGSLLAILAVMPADSHIGP
jgi:hypothetical protein